VPSVRKVHSPPPSKIKNFLGKEALPFYDRRGRKKHRQVLKKTSVEEKISHREGENNKRSGGGSLFFETT